MLPYALCHEDVRTVPSAVAYTGVPIGAEKSIPSWNFMVPYTGRGARRSPRPLCAYISEARAVWPVCARCGFLQGVFGSKKIERFDLRHKHVVESVEFSVDIVQQRAVGHRVESVVVALTLESGVSQCRSHGLGLHHHAIEVVVALGDILHNGQSLLGSAVEELEALFQCLVLLSEGLLSRRVYHII